MIKVANELPETKFLAYTKRKDIDFPKDGELPPNLIIRFSYWSNFENTTNLKHFSFLAGDKRIPKKSIICPGNCRDCSLCWENKIINVVFEKH